MKFTCLNMFTNKKFLLIGLLWCFSALTVHNIVIIPNDALRLTAMFVLVFWLPGILTAELLGLRTQWSNVQFLALGGGFGLTEALVLGQIMVVLRVPTFLLASTILLFAFGKIIWLAKRGTIPGPTGVKVNSGTFVLIALGFIAILNLVRVQRRQPVYTWWPGDSWQYLQVQVQFSDNPGQMNIQEGITAPGVNRRLLYSSWLYNRAMLVDVAKADPVVTQQRDGSYALYLLMFIVFAALGRELLDNQQAGWLAALLQFGVIAHSMFEYLLRIQEDKFFSLFVFIPLMYLVLLRVMRVTQLRNMALFVFLTIGMALIHPFNPIALFLSVIAFVFIRWRIDRQTVSRTLPIVAWMTVLLIYPVLTQIALSGDEYVATGMASARIVEWDYRVTGRWYLNVRHPEYCGGVFLLLALLVAMLRSPGDIAAQFLLGVSGGIILLLWVPPFAAIGAIIMTQVQNWRLFMLLPIGYAWAWLAIRFLERVHSTLGNARPGLIRHHLWGTAVLVILALVWGWPARMNYADWFKPDGLSPVERMVFDTNRAIVADGRVLTTELLSRVVPILWPDAKLTFWRSGVFQTESYEALSAIINMEEGVDPLSALENHGIDFLLLPPDVPLAAWLYSGSPFYTLVYESDSLLLFQAVSPITRLPSQKTTE